MQRREMLNLNISNTSLKSNTYNVFLIILKIQTNEKTGPRIIGYRN
jgi:hypothetical protein